MNMKKFFLSSIAMGLSFLWAGCGGGQETTSKGVIAYSPLTLTNPFFKVIGDHIEAEAKKHGYETLMLDPNNNPKTQSDQIDDFILKQVTAIVLVPCDRIGVGQAVKAATKAGIPVFTVDAQCTAEGVEIVSHVGTDNFQGGELAGHAMIEALGESGGKVLVLDHKIANSCVLRVDGFKKVIDAHNEGRQTGKIEIIAELPSGGDRTTGHDATANTLPAHEDLAGVFAINDPSAVGAYVALQEAGREKTVKIIGFDGQLEGKQAIKEGKIYADPIQFPDKMGVQIVEKIMDHLAGRPVEKKVLIPTSIYKQADAEKDPELK
jgi:ribose transport system substrate-binding protein